MDSSWLSWGPWSMVELTLILASIICFVFYWLFVVPLNHWKGLPNIPAVPLLGSISEAALVRKSIGEVYADIYNKRRDVKYVGFHKFTQPAILLRDPEIIEKVIVKDFNHFPSNELKGDVKLDPMFGRHLFALSGERWKRLRCAATSGFTLEKLKEIHNLIPEVCNILRIHILDKLDAEGCYDVELWELCNNFTTSVLSTSALGVPCDAINNPEVDLRKMGRKLLEPSAKKVISNLIFLQIPWLAKLLGIPFVPSEVTEYFRKVVFEEVSRREKEGKRRNDYMQMFIELWKDGKLPIRDAEAVETNSDISDGKGITTAVQKVPDLSSMKDPKEMDDITALALAYFSDGSVTTASVLSFALYELAHHEDIQQKLRKETEEVLNRHDGSINYNSLQDMHFMDMVLQEVMRLYPPAPFMTRSCSKRYKLPNPFVGTKEGSDVWIEKDIPVIIPTYGIQRDSDYYTNPEEFNPNNFSPEAMQERKHFTYYPYGEGPRVCIGIKFGLLQAKSALATLLPKFKLSPHNNTPRPIILDPRYFVTISKNGLWVRITEMH